MTPAFQELDERVRRIAGRASVGQGLVAAALLGKAGIAKTLATVTAADLEQVLTVARDEFDSDDTDELDPGPFELHRWSERWQQLRAAA